ncbi:MAG: hypothetical protein EOP54_00695 [Sphingobacteriales bacterium]|nr:MAG: hypothetical protein EOP54_00695 [Sphingobacteriales bacterium]
MPKQLPNKIPLRILIRESGKLFLCFLLGTLLITSLQDFNIDNLVYRSISLSTLFFIIFSTNTILLYYFDQNRKSNAERIWKKTFSIGYCCSLIFFFIHYSVVEWLNRNGMTMLAHKTPELQGWRFYVFMLYATLVVFSFIFLIQNFVLHQYEKSRIQLELLQLKASNSEAVNQLLQQQIQPHFLFNALNILKSLIRKDPKSAEAYLLRLSDFLRVSISNNKSGVATIEDELKVCNDYMEMQRIRFGDALQYKVDIKPDDLVLERKLPFFSLQPLLENAIKHNELTNENPLYIKIEKEGNCIKVSNNIQIKRYLEVSTGNGHNMLKERYRILDAPAPVIKTEGQIYSVSLLILDNGRSKSVKDEIAKCLMPKEFNDRSKESTKS